jgi:hypothetical protein
LLKQKWCLATVLFLRFPLGGPLPENRELYLDVISDTLLDLLEGVKEDKACDPNHASSQMKPRSDFPDELNAEIHALRMPAAGSV